MIDQHTMHQLGLSPLPAAPSQVRFPISESIFGQKALELRASTAAFSNTSGQTFGSDDIGSGMSAVEYAEAAERQIAQWNAESDSLNASLTKLIKDRDYISSGISKLIKDRDTALRLKNQREAVLTQLHQQELARKTAEKQQADRALQSLQKQNDDLNRYFDLEWDQRPSDWKLSQTASRNKGYFCNKERGGFFGDGRYNDCVRAKDVEKNRISTGMITAQNNKLRVQQELAELEIGFDQRVARDGIIKAQIEAYNKANTEWQQASSSPQLQAAQQKIDDSLARRTEMVKQIKAAEAELKRAQAVLTDAAANLVKEKGNADPEVIRERANLNKSQATLDKLRNQLAAIETSAEVQGKLIDQESQSLEASADLNKGTLPLIIIFVVIVAASFLFKPLFNKKA